MRLNRTTFMRAATLSNLFMGTVFLPPAAAGGFIRSRHDRKTLPDHIEMETAAAIARQPRHDRETLLVHIETETAAAIARQREYADNCGEVCVNRSGWCPEGSVMLIADTKFPAYMVGGHSKYVPAGCVSASNATTKKHDGELLQQAVRQEVVRAVGEGGTSPAFDFDAHLRRLAKTYEKERHNCLTSLQRSMYSKDNVSIIVLLEEARFKGFAGPIVEEASTVAAMHHVEVQLAEGRRRALEDGNIELLTSAVAATENTVIDTDSVIESLRILADVQGNQVHTLQQQVLELSNAVEVMKQNGRMLQEELAKSDDDLSLCRVMAGTCEDDVDDITIRLTAAKAKTAGVEKDLSLCHDLVRASKQEVYVCRTAEGDAASRATSLTAALSSCENAAVSLETEKNEMLESCKANTTTLMQSLESCVQIREGVVEKAAVVAEELISCETEENEMLESCQANTATLMQSLESCVQSGEGVVAKAAVVAEELISCRDKAGMCDEQIEVLRNAEKALASEATSLQARLLNTTTQLNAVNANLTETFLAKASADKTIMAMPAIDTCVGDDPSSQPKDTLITMVTKAYVEMSGSQRQQVDDAMPAAAADNTGTATIQRIAKQLAAAVGFADDNTYCAKLFAKVSQDETLVRHTSEWVTRHIAATLAEIKDEAVAMSTLYEANAAGMHFRFLLTMASLIGAFSGVLAMRGYDHLKAKMKAWRARKMLERKRLAVSRQSLTASGGLSGRVDGGVRTWARPWW